jgi:cytochrome c oxidase assembly factor CtaG
MIAVLADASLPPLRGSQLFSTQFDFVPVAMVLIALVAYLWGVKRVNQRQPRHQWSGVKTAAFIGGLVSTGIGIFSFIGVYDGELFWDHMVQHLILIMVAAPLFALGSPIDLAWRATTGTPHVVVTEILRSRVAKVLGHPGVAFCLYAVMIPLTHLTVWYNYTLEHESVHNAEHLVFLGVGYLFWRQIFGSDPNCYRMHPILQFGYLFLAIPIDTFTGLSLDQAVHEMFPAYYALHRTWGPSLVDDLHIGGVIMWVGGDTLMLWPMIPIAIRWLHLEERRAIRADRLLDQQEAEAAATATSAAAAAAAAATAAATTAGTGALPGT